MSEDKLDPKTFRWLSNLIGGNIKHPIMEKWMNDASMESVSELCELLADFFEKEEK